MRYYLPTDECARCKGCCCKRLPGCALPRDFGLPKPAGYERLQAALASGRWCIDWWETATEPLAYFVRPAVKGCEGMLYDPSWGGECTFLTPTGCELPWEQRPAGCRAIEPRPDATSGCIVHGADRRRAKERWKPYRDWLEQCNVCAPDGVKEE